MVETQGEDAHFRIIKSERRTAPSGSRAGSGVAWRRPAAEAEVADLDLLDAIWHILDFLAPALGSSVLAASFAKLFWRSALRSVGWIRLSCIAACAAAAVLLGGLVVLGHDGRIATYAAMIGAIAFSLWWVGFRPFRG